MKGLGAIALATWGALVQPAASCTPAEFSFAAASSGGGDPTFSLYTATEFAKGASGQPQVSLPLNAASSLPLTLCLAAGDYVARLAVALGADPTGDASKTFGGVTVDGGTYTMKAPGSAIADAQAGAWDGGTLATTWAIEYPNPAACTAQLAVVATMDSYPSEGSWELVDTSTSSTVHSVPSLAPVSSRSVEELCLLSAAVYEFRLADSYGRLRRCACAAPGVDGCG